MSKKSFHKAKKHRFGSVLSGIVLHLLASELIHHRTVYDSIRFFCVFFFLVELTKIALTQQEREVVFFLFRDSGSNYDSELVNSLCECLQFIAG